LKDRVCGIALISFLKNGTKVVKMNEGCLPLAVGCRPLTERWEAAQEGKEHESLQTTATPKIRTFTPYSQHPYASANNSWHHFFSFDYLPHLPLFSCGIWSEKNLEWM
jgi:hypothetical protein